MVAQRFVGVLQLQHDGFVVTERAAVCTAGHGEVVDDAETVEAGVTADFMDGAAQDHFMFSLQNKSQKISEFHRRDHTYSQLVSAINLVLFSPQSKCARSLYVIVSLIL